MSVRRIWPFLLISACARRAPATGEPTASHAPVTVGVRGASPPIAMDPALDWSFLGPRDDALADRLRSEQALVGPYLVAPSRDGELSVAKEHVDALLEYASALLREHTGEISPRILAADGQRYLQAAWLERRGREAGEGRASLVRIPLRACVGWGCEVPSEFVAVDCFGPAAFFIVPVGDTSEVEACRACLRQESEEARASCEEAACNLFAEGWFTGETRRGSAEDGEPCGVGWTFNVARTRDVPGPGFELVVPAGSAAP